MKLICTVVLRSLSVPGTLHRSLIVVSLYRLAEGFYHNLECGVHLKGEKRRQKMPEKIDEEKFYATDVRA